jgi:DNA (cytosine-5)-methyltransferase 1
VNLNQFPRVLPSTVGTLEYPFFMIGHESAASPGSWSVVDLFSGAGGASYGFHAHPKFRVIGASDVEVGKPSTGHGAIDCNSTYLANIGVSPIAADLGVIDPADLADQMGVGSQIDVLIACPPCTGFSCTIADNHIRDDPRNSLVAMVADFAPVFQPKVIFLENARELLRGRFTHHFRQLTERLQEQGYRVRGDIHMLTRFGLPQQRERSLVIAVKDGLPLPGLAELWAGHYLDEKATHVRRAIWDLPPIESGNTHPDDAAHSSTLSEGLSLQRIKAIPQNGGSWADLLADPAKRQHLTPAMLRAANSGHLNWFCDVYGRMAWDRPAPTIKRECSHVGNGRYLHPEQHRLCTVREMAILQGFPRDYRFPTTSRKNAYRNIGDALPPLISYQIAHLVEWILSGHRPKPDELILSHTNLSALDILPSE